MIQIEIRTLPSSQIDREMLKVLFVENLNHSRHVEMERVTFIALSTALVVGALSVVREIDSNFLQILAVVALAFFNNLCEQLTTRWGDVFKTHMLTAKRILLLLSGVPEEHLLTDRKTNDGDLIWDTDFINGHKVIREYYVFNNRAHMERIDEPQKTYLQTTEMFNRYNVFVEFCLLIIYFVYSLELLSSIPGKLPRMWGIAEGFVITAVALLWVRRMAKEVREAMTQSDSK